nr:hypothetical protein [Tanacetum cinerariifolium]
LSRIGPKNVNNASAMRYAMEQLCDESITLLLVLYLLIEFNVCVGAGMASTDANNIRQQPASQHTIMRVEGSET